jgi:hypothetical protein
MRMANNRLYLIHNPTGKKFMISKRMGWGWYAKDDIKEKINDYFDDCADGENQDDFDLMIEDNSNCKHIKELPKE